MIILRNHWSTLQSVRGGKIQNHLDVVPKRGHTGSRDAVAKEVKFGNGKHALLQVDVQPFVSEDGRGARLCVVVWGWLGLAAALS